MWFNHFMLVSSLSHLYLKCLSLSLSNNDFSTASPPLIISVHFTNDNKWTLQKKKFIILLHITFWCLELFEESRIDCYIESKFRIQIEYYNFQRSWILNTCLSVHFKKAESFLRFVLYVQLHLSELNVRRFNHFPLYCANRNIEDFNGCLWIPIIMCSTTIRWRTNRMSL